MAYVKIIYQNSPSTATPINAQNLNHMDDGIAENDRRLNELETAGVVNKFNGRSGNVTPEKNDYDISLIGATAGEDGYVPVWRNSGTEEDPDWGFEMEQQGGSGHKILDADGNEMAQEDSLQFADSFVSDDDVNGKTVIENIKEVTLAELSQATERGMYLATDEESVPIGEIGEDYVEVDGTTSMTYGDVLSEIFSKADLTKINDNSTIDVLGGVYFVTARSSNAFTFSTLSGNNSRVVNGTIEYSNGTVALYDYDLYAHSRQAVTNTNLWKNGKITLYYGTSSGIVELNTDISYSTAERKIGKWIDGSDLYEKTVSCGALPNNAEKTVAHNISNLKYVVDIKGIAIRETNPIAYPMPFLSLDNLNYGIQVNVGTTNVVITTKSNLSYLDKSYVTLRYIKA